MNRTLTALTALILLPAASAQVSVQQVTAQISKASNSVVAYLPDLQNAPLAQSLKVTANRNVPVTVLTTRKAHMIRGSYLLSVALAGAQTPPKPLTYAWVNLDSPPVIVIDRTTVYYGAGLVSGTSTVQKGSAAFASQSYQTLTRLADKAGGVPARRLVEERYGIPPVPKPNLP